MANCRRIRGGILGWIESVSFSNSARVMVVLQLGSAVLSAGGLSHNPLMVTIVASGATFEASVSLLSTGFADAAGAAGCWVSCGGVEFAACPQAVAPSSRQSST